MLKIGFIIKTPKIKKTNGIFAAFLRVMNLMKNVFELNLIIIAVVFLNGHCPIRCFVVNGPGSCRLNIWGCSGVDSGFRQVQCASSHARNEIAKIGYRSRPTLLVSVCWVRCSAGCLATGPRPPQRRRGRCVQPLQLRNTVTLQMNFPSPFDP